MSTDTNRLIARRWCEELWSEGRLYVADAIVAQDYVRHDPADTVPVTGPAGVKRLVTTLRAALPDLCVVVEATIAEEDHVATRITIRAISEGRPICVTATEVLRIAGDKVVESWTNRDDLGMWQQLARLPAKEA